MSEKITFGQKMADKFASGMGSWTFLILQSSILILWMVFNVFSIHEFDPYPFILLNLVLSFQAAYAAPIIMMANNRKEEIDRARSIQIYLLEKKQHKNFEELLVHLDEKFDTLNKKIEQIEAKKQS